MNGSADAAKAWAPWDGSRAFRVLRAIVITVWATGALASCRSVDAENYPCSAQGACPSGFTCGAVDHLCHGPKTQMNGIDAGCQGAACASDGPPSDIVTTLDAGDTAVAPTDARDTAAEAAADTRDGALGGSDASDGSVVCTVDGGGLGCDLPDRCHVGRVVCTGNQSTCHDTGEVQSDGISCGTGMVCSGGMCKSCAADTACPRVGQPCKQGTISCSTGLPVCLESGNAPEGAPCGTNLVCAAGTCVPCVAGGLCIPTNPCHDGTLTCAGAPACADKGTSIKDGSGCGTNKVCFQGTCSDCLAGQSCPVAGKPCRTGKTQCDTGQLVCVESGNANNGDSCGTGRVCSNGSCIDCVANAACTPSNPCHTGMQSCTGGTQTCVDSGVALKDGSPSSCGTNKVCSHGACVDCTAGQGCTPAGTICKVGQTACDTGAQVCGVTGNAQSGSSCGTGMVCNSSGGCILCAAGTPCTPPTAPCHAGTQACTGGVPSCTDLGTPLMNGTTCGNRLVCNGGTCVACGAGDPCTPGGNMCQTGVTACNTGTQTCTVTGNVNNGMPCGTNLVCNGGACVMCMAGACTPANAPCHVGSQTCSTGGPVCTDTTTPAANGTGCGMNLVCNGGMCVSCAANVPCTPPGTVCKVGSTVCTSGTQVCQMTGNAADTTVCAAGKQCLTGNCVANPGCGTTPALNCPCTSSGQLACNGAHQKLQLICGNVPGLTGLAWQTVGTCASTENCDSADGSCKTIIPQCVGQAAGFAYCEGVDIRHTCGPDLVTATSMTCTGTCDPSLGCVAARCGDHKIEAGEQCDDGNNTPIDGCEPASAPVGIPCTASRVLSIAPGFGHTCALFAGGYVRCWGNNTLGQLGLGHAEFEGNLKPFQLTMFNAAGNPIPAGPVDLGGSAIAVAAGADFTCAILGDNSVRCWGVNDQGQLGRGNVTPQLTATPNSLGPVNVGGLANAISVGGNTACVLLSDGTVRCWGANAFGLLGTGNAVATPSTTMTPNLIPLVSLGTTATAISVGSGHACALLTGGTVRCWGANFDGELGLGDALAHSTMTPPSGYGPVLLPTGKTATSISVGDGFSCARLNDGTAESWGFNGNGQLGVGTTAAVGDNESPATGGRVMGPAAGVTSIFTSGGQSTCSLFANGGGLHCWGDNMKGQLGYPDLMTRGNTTTSLPSNTTAINFGAGLSATLYLGNSHACAILSNGALHCWGWNNNGQLGLGFVSQAPTDFVGGSSTTTPDTAVTLVQLFP